MNQNQSISLHQNNSAMNNQNSQQNNGQNNNVQQVSGSMVNQFNALQNTPVSSATSGFPSQSPDFNLDNFLDMPQGDSNNYLPPDLDLNSIELVNEYGFNLQDMF